MKKVLILLGAVVAMVGASIAPAHSEQIIPGSVQHLDNRKFNIEDCPVLIVAAYIQKPRLVSSQPLDIGFGVEVGDSHAKPTAERCASNHTLRAVSYLYFLPIGGPRSLVATAAQVGFCTECSAVFSVGEAVAPPGIYEVVGDVGIEDVGRLASLTTRTFLYDGIEIVPLG